MTVQNESQQLQPSERVELFILDLSGLGGLTYYFVKANLEPTDVVWQGNTYIPFDFETEGFELNGRDSIPTPKIRVSATNQLLTGLVNEFNDLVNAKVTRIITHRKFLDDSDSANPAAHYPLDIFRIDRKSVENKFMIEFELASVLDQQGRQLPGRTIVGNYCPWRYRVWNGGTSGDPLLDFNYHPADNACPYQGDDYYDLEGNVTTAENDRCSKRVNTGCKARFGEDAVLPYGGFPGASRPIF